MAVIDMAVSEQLIDLEVEELKRQALASIKDETIAGAESFGNGDFKTGFTSLKANDGNKVVLYSTRDGSTSLVNALHLKEPMKRRHPDGTPVFSTRPVNPAWEYRTDPKTGQPQVVKGQLLCFLHPDHPERVKWDSIGLGGQLCKKDNLPSDFQRIQHMRSKHGTEWETMQAHREQLQRDEAAEVMRQQVAAMQAIASQQGAVQAIASQQGAVQAIASQQGAAQKRGA